MNLSTRQLVRIADRIRDHLHMQKAGRYRQMQEAISDLLQHTRRLQVFQQRLRLCATHSWHGAAAKVIRHTTSTVRDLMYDLQQLEQILCACHNDIPRLSDLYRELVQTSQEFGNLSYDANTRALTVTTEPIELEGIDLGPFEIRLHLDELVDPHRLQPFSVIALDPHPAAHNEAVTHPHVSDEMLCPGDAARPIRAALTGGRICDVFLLVRSVLRTYNPASAYVRLEAWDGIACYECGHVMASDEVCRCYHCDRDFCDECASFCPQCDEITCLGCLTECYLCREWVCPDCITRCPDCDRPLCRTCLQEGRCPCRKESQNENNRSSASEQTHEATASTGPETD